MMDSSTLERVVFYSNNFTKNAGYIDSNVIFIRARTSTLSATAPNLESASSLNSPTSYCGGYVFDSNTF
jgi:hypothetical protein